MVLRLCIAGNIIAKLESGLDWEWATAFWPFWCSFIIQAVLVISTIVIFLNTLALFCKRENKCNELLGSFWGLLMASGFMFATLYPVLMIIKIYDAGDLAEKVIKQFQMTEQERHVWEMLTERKNEIAYEICFYPILYCFSAFTLTFLLRKQIVEWFEIILYQDFEDGGNRRRSHGAQNAVAAAVPEEVVEYTLGSDSEEAQVRQLLRQPKLKTYSF